MQARKVPGQSHAEWLALPDTHRALVIRNRVDEQFLAVQQQHERIVAYCRLVHRSGLALMPRADIARGMNDIDFFLLALGRLKRVCKLVRESALPTGSLRQAATLFDKQIAPIVRVRNVLEHLDGSALGGQGGIGIGTGADTVILTYEGAEYDTRKLLAAAREVHAAIRAVVDPIAAADVHSDSVIVVLPEE